MSDISRLYSLKNNKCVPKQQFRILIVDDDDNIAESFAEILTERGHCVTIINESLKCVNNCKNNQYDIIFMDFHLDRMNGTDTTELIKDIYNYKSLIFAFTGDDSNMAISKFRDIGMDGAIIKPLDIDLINKLMNSLEVKHDIDRRVIKSIKDIKLKKQLFVFN